MTKDRYCLIPRGMDDYSFKFCKLSPPLMECKNCCEHIDNEVKNGQEKEKNN